jgi:hypothetical protein
VEALWKQTETFEAVASVQHRRSARKGDQHDQTIKCTTGEREGRDGGSPNDWERSFFKTVVERFEKDGTQTRLLDISTIKDAALLP